MTSLEELRSIGMFSEGRDAASISQICIIFRIVKSSKLTCVTELNLKTKFETCICKCKLFKLAEFYLWIGCFTSLASSFLLSTEETCLVKSDARFVFEMHFLKV